MRAALPVHEIVARYKLGENTYQLGDAYGVDQKTIWRRLRAAGVNTRPRGGPVGNKKALGHKGKGSPKRGGPFYDDGQGYLGTLDRAGKKCRIHRGCWEAYHGPIPEGFIVHHVNGNKQDNRVENLACMSHGEHTVLHNQRGE